MLSQWKYYCQDCQSHSAVDQFIWKCPDCGGLLDLQEMMPGSIRWQIEPRQPGLWRYRSLLPIEPGKDPLTLGEGFTPLHQISFAGRTIWLKHDYLCPTGSYKDRGAAVLVNHAAMLGINAAVEDSSGNAGCAIAAYCALAGISCQIYVPAATSPNKLHQIEAYGAAISKIPGTRQDTSIAADIAARTIPYFSHIYSPFFYQGTKTIAFELFEQMDGQIPDQIILPAGHGTMLIGIWLGFSQLKQLGLISHLPKLIAVQAGNCAPLYAAWSNHETAAETPTLAEGIAIARPPRLKQMLQAIKQSEGMVDVVSEAEISHALNLANQHGIFIEPTSAVVLATAWRLGSSSRLNGRTVCILSGHGLKSVKS